LEREANSLPEALRADALYPIDYVHNVNRARIDIGTFDVDKEIAAANEIVAASKSGKDPFAARTGDFKRHYVLKTAGEVMPYRLYIPSKYDGTRAFPLIVALHGLGGTEDSMFGQNYAMLPEAEKRGYIMVAPLGYRIDGGYGRVTGGARRAQLSSDACARSCRRMVHFTLAARTTICAVATQLTTGLGSLFGSPNESISPPDR